MNQPENSYLESVRKQFVYYKALADKAIAQLEPAQLFERANEDTNSIALIVNHISGNMLSRWSDFLHSDGEKPWRNRDAEFEEVLRTKEEVLEIWEKGWKCLFDALAPLTDGQLSEIVYIRNEGHTVMEAINRQLAHYPYHVGQIVFYAKMLKKTQWESLSIPKKASEDYNAGKFAQEKARRHFTDGELGTIK